MILFQCMTSSIVLALCIILLQNCSSLDYLFSFYFPTLVQVFVIMTRIDALKLGAKTEFISVSNSRKVLIYSFVLLLHTSDLHTSFIRTSFTVIGHIFQFPAPLCTPLIENIKTKYNVINLGLHPRLHYKVYITTSKISKYISIFKW